MFKIFRCYILMSLFKFLYKIKHDEKIKDKLNHYKRKYSLISVKTVSYKKFYEYIKQRAYYSIYEVEKLAEPLPFNVKSNEIWGWNDFYGTAENYKKYIGYPSDYKLKFIIDHAVYFYDGYVNMEEYEINLPSHIVTSEYAKKIFEKHTDKLLFPTGLHIYYADDYYNEIQFEEEKKRLGKNLLVFPFHSSDCLLCEWEPEKFIKEILKTKEKGNFNSVTICFYFAEIQRNFHKNFEGYGFNFVTAGHILDVKFLSRLKTIIKLSDVTMSNAVGSHIFYSIGLDKPHYLVNEKNVKFHNTANCEEKDTQQKSEDEVFNHKIFDEYERIFKDYRETLTDEQIKLKEKICDKNSIKKKEEIRKYFEETEKLYKTGKYLKQNNKFNHIFTLMSYLDDDINIKDKEIKKNKN